ncbi:MAG: transposase [Nitrososphaeria archaeon]
MSVEDVRGSLLRKMFIADYVKMGYKVNYLIGPNENKETFLEDVIALLGSMEGVNIVTFNAKDYDYKADKMPYMQTAYKENVVNIINIFAIEDFALKDPIEFEIYVREAAKLDTELNRISMVIGYSGQEALNKEIDEISNKIKEIANDNKDAKLLMSIPGISFYSALFIISEIGDINRFPDSGHLVSYAIAPSTRSSGNKVYHGLVTKQLLKVDTQIKWANIRKEPNGTVGNFYSKLKKKKGSSKAIVATSAKLLRKIYWVLKEHRPYQS